MVSATAKAFTITFDSDITKDSLSVKAKVPSAVETNRTEEKPRRMPRTPQPLMKQTLSPQPRYSVTYSTSSSSNKCVEETTRMYRPRTTSRRPPNFDGGFAAR